MDLNKVKVGNRVCVVRDRINSEGTLHFIGTTAFADGEWIGVELDQSQDGNNDGKVDGVSYFECPRGTGVFVRRNEIELLNSIINLSVTDSANPFSNESANIAATISATIITATRTVANYKLCDRVSVVHNKIQLEGTLR
ncbi:hypothetical protein HK100_008941, partial [Physocladia obscura]